MKTEAIREAFSLAAEMDRENTVMSQAREELAALEESHAEMVKVLLNLGGVTLNGWHTDACIEYDHGPHCEAARNALVKAGAL